jgi:hypothetical protein
MAFPIFQPKSIWVEPIFAFSGCLKVFCSLFRLKKMTHIAAQFCATTRVIIKLENVFNCLKIKVFNT